MKVHHTLICFFFFFLSLQGENFGLVHAQIIVYSGAEGGAVTVECSLSRSGSRKFFCKANCKEEDILIQTTGVRAQRGRYSIEYRTSGGVFMTITQLRKSDSGLYSCGHDSDISDKQIEIIVVDATLRDPGEKTLNARTGGTIVVECAFSLSASRTYFCKDKCEQKDILVETPDVRVRKGRYSIEYIEASPAGGFLYVSITQLNRSDSGRYRCVTVRRSAQRFYRKFTVVVTDDATISETNSASTAATTQSSGSEQQQAEMTPAADVWLYVGLTLAVMVVLLSLAVLIYCRKISAKPDEPPVETEYDSVSQTNRVYEDIGEDRQIRSPLAEDDSSKLTYSELNFSRRTGGLRHSAPAGNDDNVVYSAPRLKARSDTRRAKDDPPVYSAVT